MAGVVETVSAQVKYEFPLDERTNSAYASHMPSGTLTIKQFEEFLFNARIRGAEDNTKCTVQTRRFWNGSTHETRPSALSVDVNATMDGMPLYKEPSETKKTGINWPTIAMQIIVSAAMILIIALL